MLKNPLGKVYNRSKDDGSWILMSLTHSSPAAPVQLCDGEHQTSLVFILHNEEGELDHFSLNLVFDRPSTPQMGNF